MTNRFSVRSYRGRWHRGVASGYHRCCVAWFCTVRVPLVPGWYKGVQLRVISRHPRLAAHGYVRCPLCSLARRWRTVEPICTCPDGACYQ